MALFIDVNCVDPPCNGCLSTDRKLSPVAMDKTTNVFHDIPFSNKTTSNLWCFECKALIGRVITFKKQVKEAQNIISNYQSPSEYLTLSKLTKHINEKIIQITHNEYNNLDTDSKFIPIECDITSVGVTIISKETHSEENVQECDVKPQFIKVENVDDGVYAEENQLNVEDNAIEPSQSDFDDSDDECLQFKKRRKEESEKKSRSHRKRERASGVINSKLVAKKLNKFNITNGSIEMVLLSWEQVEEERRKMLESDRFTRSEYKCHHCGLGFNHRFKLDNHNVAKHEQKPNCVYCEVCSVRCKDDRALTAHKRRHRVRWRCVFCGSSRSRLSNALDHLRSSHGTTLTHTCNTCGEKYPTLTKLRCHMKSHSESERQNCHLCGKTFPDKTALKIHLFIHNGEKEFSCTVCNKKFLFKKHLENHMLSHGKSELLYCHECDKNFKNKMSLYQHIKYTLKHIDPGRLKYACEQCEKRFKSPASLEAHNSAIHLKIKPIKCTVEGCDFAFSSKPRLRSHIGSVHRNQKPKRNHVCDLCGKAYTSRKCLEGHIRSHWGSRPLACPLCEASFGYASALYTHHRLVHAKKSKDTSATK